MNSKTNQMTKPSGTDITIVGILKALDRLEKREEKFRREQEAAWRKQEQERKKREKEHEKERLEQEKLREKERLEREKERLEQEKLREKERLEREKERLEQEKIREKERLEQEKLREEERQKAIESWAALNESMKKNQEMVGSLSNTIGRWSEVHFRSHLWEKMNKFGYNFGTGTQGNREFFRKGKKIAECDNFLENGDVVCIVEVKHNVTYAKIDQHLKKIEIIREWMDNRGDKRIIIGAMAGIIFEEDMKEYTFSKGMYVLTQTYENTEVVEPPVGWSAKTW